MTAPRTEALSAEYVRAALAYDEATGILTWRERADVGAWWNTRYAGTVAGNVRADGYVVICLAGRQYLAHRLGWLHVHGEWPEGDLDHIRGAKNRIANLRPATRSQNQANRGLQRNNAVGMKGVSPLPNGRFRAQIQISGTRRHLGVFYTPEAAHDAYCEAAHELFGEYARAA